MKWEINVDGLIVEILRIIIDEIRAQPTHSMGWFNSKLRNAWFNSGECRTRIPSLDDTKMGNDDRPLVEVHVKHPGSERIEETSMELHSSAFTDPGVMQSDSREELDCKENDGGPSHRNKFYGQLTRS